MNMNLRKPAGWMFAVILTVAFVLSSMPLGVSQAYAADEPQAEATGQAPEEPTAAEETAPPSQEPSAVDDTAPPSEEPPLAAESQPSVMMKAAEEPGIVTEADGTQYARDEVIVKFKSAVSDSAIMNTLDAQGSEVLSTIEACDLAVAEVPEGETVESFIDTLEAQPNVEYAEPNYFYTIDATVSDPRYSEQWYLNKINIPNTWDMTMGLPDIKVAVLDTGIDLTHPEFSGQIFAQEDMVYYDGNAQDDSIGEKCYGHGTHVAGIIGAKPNNGQGISGVAPGVSLIAVDVFDGDGAWTYDVIEGIQYAVANGADVINMSLGGPGTSTSFENAITDAVNKGVVCVVAAGNDNTSIYYSPSDCTDAISVIATDQNDKRAAFSNFGPLKDISAPGVDILSTYPIGSYKYLPGTSMASPIVAGVVALMRSLNPDLTVAQVKNILYSTAVDLGDSGFDAQFANGRVDANAAVYQVWNALPSYSISLTKTLTGYSDSFYGNVYGNGSYKHRTKAVLTAVPESGYHFVRWTEDGTEVSTSATYAHVVTKATTLRAEFGKDIYTIWPAANNASYGSVSGGGSSYFYGDSVTLTATPNDDYLFVRWSDNGTTVSTNATYTFSASKSATITAEFAEQYCTITAITNNSSGGSVSGSGTVAYGTSVTLTATPNTYYAFTGWRENDVLVSTDASYTFTATKSTTIEAVFEVSSCTISVAANSPSFGSVWGGGTYIIGQFAAVQASPFTGYRFVRWTENGVPVCYTPYYPITASRNMSLIAEFAPLTPITISCTKTDVTYTGGSNGTITVTPSGGDSGRYMYAIDGRGLYASNVFTGLSAGTYTITACDWYYNENATSITVTVGEPFSNIILPAKSLPNGTHAGYKLTIIPPAPPKGYTTQSVSFASSNPAVAATDANGNVAFVGGGKVTITTRVISQTIDSKGRVKTKTTTVKKTITVQQPVSSISLNMGDATIARKAKLKLSAIINPGTASNKKLTWKSSNPKIASVSSSGVVTGKAGGTAVITCTAKDGSGAAASCTVNVTPIYPTGLKMSKTAVTVKLGKTTPLKATIAPKNTDFKTITWTSSNPAVASVDAKGKVRAVAPGTAVITAITSNGIAASCTVTVP